MNNCPTVCLHLIYWKTSAWISVGFRQGCVWHWEFQNVFIHVNGCFTFHGCFKRSTDPKVCCWADLIHWCFDMMWSGLQHCHHQKLHLNSQGQYAVIKEVPAYVAKFCKLTKFVNISLGLDINQLVLNKPLKLIPIKCLKFQIPFVFDSQKYQPIHSVLKTLISYIILHFIGSPTL